MKKKRKTREGATGSGDFGHAGRKAEQGGSAPLKGIDYKNVKPRTQGDPVVAQRPRSEPGPLEPHEVELGRMIDAGEVETFELDKDGKMAKSNWPKEWPE